MERLLTRKLVNYSATFFSKPDCKGDKGKGEHKNFGCSEICWPSPKQGVYSILLKVKEFEQMPWYKPGKDEEYHNDGFGGKYQYVDTEGPIGLAYSDAECNPKSFMGRTFIPKGNDTKCVTFEQPVFGWSIKLLKECTYEEMKDVAEVDSNHTTHDWYQPKEEDLHLVREWEEFHRSQKSNPDEDDVKWGVVWPGEDGE
jgi:hypothetical protein